MSNSARISATAALEKRAESLEFVGHGDGGPTIIMPTNLRERWFGIFDAEGEPDDQNSHYELACDAASNILEFEGDQAFVLDEEGSTAFLATDEGALLIRWVGADTSAGVLAAVEACSFAPIMQEGAPVVWRVSGGHYTLMHAGEDGRCFASDDTEEASAEFELAKGDYAVEQIDAEGSVEWQGEVVFEDETAEEVMVQAYRLRRL